MDGDPALATCFEANRPLLRSVALRLSESPEDAEDTVQAAWIKASAAPIADVDNPSGSLTTITAERRWTDCALVVGERRPGRLR